MYFMKRNPDFKSLCIRFYSLVRKNYYDVLNLNKNCSDKEIKEAFIRMSKEYHPDKNKDAKAQDKFVSIVEAYNVLSKPCSRAQYDSMFMNTYSQGFTVYRTPNYGGSPQYSQFNQNVHKERTVNESTNIKKIPNIFIILMCCGVVLVGALLQVFVIREMYTAQRRQALEKSKQCAEELEKVRAAARNNSNEVQTRLLLEKIMTAANPTVATASLGQTLANEKKDVHKVLADLPEDWTIARCKMKVY